MDSRAEQVAHFHFDKVKHFRIVDLVDLVDEDDKLLDADLTGEQQVLSGLRHLTVRSGNDNDCTLDMLIS